MTLVIPESSRLQGSSDHLFNLALRLAHNLLAYLNMDCNIITDTELLTSTAQADLSSEGLIVFGGPNQNRFALSALEDSAFPIKFTDGSAEFRLQNRTFSESGIG